MMQELKSSSTPALIPIGSNGPSTLLEKNQDTILHQRIEDNQAFRNVVSRSTRKNSLTEKDNPRLTDIEKNHEVKKGVSITYESEAMPMPVHKFQQISSSSRKQIHLPGDRGGAKIDSSINMDLFPIMKPKRPQKNAS